MTSKTPQATTREGRATRRRFLTIATIGVGGGIAGVVATPAAGYLLAPVAQEARFQPTSLGRVSEFAKTPGFPPTAAPYVQDPAQPETSAGLAYVAATGGGNTDWLAGDAMFVVFSNRCMHVGCPVAATTVGFACPCHGGQYDTSGRRVAGPPIRPLDRFAWEIRRRAGGDELWITERWSVEIDGTRVSYFPAHAPGQPLELPGPSFVADLAYPALTYDERQAPEQREEDH